MFSSDLMDLLHVEQRFYQMLKHWKCSHFAQNVFFFFFNFYPARPKIISAPYRLLHWGESLLS